MEEEEDTFLLLQFLNYIDSSFPFFLDDLHHIINQSLKLSLRNSTIPVHIQLLKDFGNVLIVGVLNVETVCEFAKEHAKLMLLDIP